MSQFNLQLAMTGYLANVPSQIIALLQATVVVAPPPPPTPWWIVALNRALAVRKTRATWNQYK